MHHRLALALSSLLLAQGCGGDERKGDIGDPSVSVTDGDDKSNPGSGGAPLGYDGAFDPSHVNYAKGAKLPRSLAFDGYADLDAQKLTSITLGDFYDPDHAKGYHALLITSGTPICPPCLAEVSVLKGKLDGPWKGKGVKVLQLLVRDEVNDPATPDAAQRWKRSQKLPWAVAADPKFTFGLPGSNPYPIQVVVDPVTLEVVERYEGFRQDLPAVDALIAAN